MLNGIPKSILEEQNERMARLPMEEEVKQLFLLLMEIVQREQKVFQVFFFKNIEILLQKILLIWSKLSFVGGNSPNLLPTQI